MQTIESQEQLFQFLKDELNYCACASGYALKVLYDTLKLIEERSQKVQDTTTFRQKTEEIETLLQLDSSLGLGEWFVYFLENKNFITHGFNSSDCWITEKGKILLNAIATFSP